MSVENETGKQYPGSNKNEEATNLSMVEESADAETKFEIDEDSLKEYRRRVADLKSGKTVAVPLKEAMRRFEAWKANRDAV